MTQDNEQTRQPAAVPEAPLAPQEPAAHAIPDAITAPPGAAAGPRDAELEAEVARLKTEILYAKAETENVRRRLEQQAEDRSKYAVATFARDVLAVADNLRRALDHVQPEQRDNAGGLIAGVEMTERDLLNTFERYGIKRMEAMGSRFDPNLHQAMMEMDDPSKPMGTVVMVAQQGYTLHDRLLRPAMVAVSKGGPKAAPGEGEPAAAGDSVGRVDTSV